MIPRHGLGKIREKRKRKEIVIKLGEDNRERRIKITDKLVPRKVAFNCQRFSFLVKTYSHSYKLYGYRFFINNVFNKCSCMRLLSLKEMI